MIWGLATAQQQRDRCEGPERYLPIGWGEATYAGALCRRTPCEKRAGRRSAGIARPDGKRRMRAAGRVRRILPSFFGNSSPDGTAQHWYAVC